jgi:hypothetical protein
VLAAKTNSAGHGQPGHTKWVSDSSSSFFEALAGFLGSPAQNSSSAGSSFIGTVPPRPSLSESLSRARHSFFVLFTILTPSCLCEYLRLSFTLLSFIENCQSRKHNNFNNASPSLRDPPARAVPVSSASRIRQFAGPGFSKTNTQKPCAGPEASGNGSSSTQRGQPAGKEKAGHDDSIDSVGADSGCWIRGVHVDVYRAGGGRDCSARRWHRHDHDLSDHDLDWNLEHVDQLDFFYGIGC